MSLVSLSAFALAVLSLFAGRSASAPRPAPTNADAIDLVKAGLELLWQPATLTSGAQVSLAPNTSYGCGLMLDTRPGQRSAGHSGGGNAAFRYYLDEDMLIVMATNGKTQEDALVDRIARAAREMQPK